MNPGFSDGRAAAAVATPPQAAAGRRASGAGGRLELAAVWLIAGVALVPLVVVPGVTFPYVVPRTVLFRLLVAGAFGCWIWALVLGRFSLRGRPDLVLVGLGAVTAAGALAGALGTAPLRSFFSDLERLWGVWTWFHLLLFYLLARALLDREARWRAQLLAWLGVALLVAAYGSAELARGGGAAVRISSTLGNPGYLAGYLLFMTAFTGVALLRARRWRWRVAWALALLLFLALIGLAQTRGAYLAVAAAVLWGGVAGGFVLRGRARRWVPAALAVVLLAGAGALLLARSAPDHPLVAAAPPLQRLGTLAGGSGGAGARLLAWDAAWSGFRARPVLGWGPENFTDVYAAHGAREWYLLAAGDLRWDRVHNSYLDALVSTGVVGGAAFLLLLGGVFRHLLVARRRRAFGGGEFLLLSGAALGYVVFLAFWFEELGALLPFLLLAAYAGWRADGPLLERREVPAERRSAHLVIAGLATALLAAGTYLHGVQVLASARALHAAELARERGDAPADVLRLAGGGLAAHASRLHALNFHAGYLGDVAPDARQLRESPADSAAVDRAIVRSFVELEREIAREPRNALLRVQRARVALAAALFHGEPRFLRVAAASVDEAIRLNPTRIRHRHLLAEVLRMAGDTAAARAQLDTARVIEPRDSSTSYFYGRLAADAGRPDVAAELYRRALEGGYRAPATSYSAVGDAALRTGDAAAAAAAALLYNAYLRPVLRPRSAPRAAAPATWPLPPPLLRLDDARIAARLPVAHARAGHTAAALSAADAFAWAAPQFGEQAAAFRADVAAGGTGPWLEWHGVVPDSLIFRWATRRPRP
jgi:O-antigen ligase